MPKALQIVYIFKVNKALGSVLPTYSKFLSSLSAFFKFNLSPPVTNR